MAKLSLCWKGSVSLYDASYSLYVANYLLTGIRHRLPVMPISRSVIFPLILVLALSACTGGRATTPQPPVLITVAGSTAMQPLVSDLAAAYTERHPQVSFDIRGGGSLSGQRLVESKQVDLGMISGPPDELVDEIQLTPVALDGIAIIVHPETGLEGLSLKIVQDIFAGRLLSWQELDGPAWPIKVVSREDGSGTRAAFEAHIMNGLPVTLAAVVLPSSRAVVEFVAGNPGSIAYVSQAFVDGTVYAVPLSGIAPTLETITANHYPLVRELTLVVPAQPRPDVARFVEFTLSSNGQSLVKERWGVIQ